MHFVLTCRGWSRCGGGGFRSRRWWIYKCGIAELYDTSYVSETWVQQTLILFTSIEIHLITTYKSSLLIVKTDWTKDLQESPHDRPGSHIPAYSPTPGIELGPHGWESRTLTSAPVEQLYEITIFNNYYIMYMQPGNGESSATLELSCHWADFHHDVVVFLWQTRWPRFNPRYVEFCKSIVRSAMLEFLNSKCCKCT